MVSLVEELLVLRVPCLAAMEELQVLSSESVELCFHHCEFILKISEVVCGGGFEDVGRSELLFLGVSLVHRWEGRLQTLFVVVSGHTDQPFEESFSVFNSLERRNFVQLDRSVFWVAC